MKKLTALTVLAVLSISGVYAQRLQGRFVTSAYAWDRQDTIGKSSQHLYGYETMQLSLSGEQLSLHTYLQGFNDFAGPLSNNPTLRLYNFYFKWANVGNVADVSLGRQAIFAGVGNGTVDGGLASFRFLDSRVKLTGYYGALPAERYEARLIDNTDKNYMAGGQLSASPLDFAQFSISFMKKNIKPETYLGIRRDSLFNPYMVEITPTATAEEYVSGDVSLEYKDLVSGYLRYDYDLLLDKNSRFQFFTRVKPFQSLDVKFLEPLSLTGEYLQREPRLLFNSIFSVFAFNTLKEYEVGAEYAIGTEWQLFAKYGDVSYNDGDSHQMTLGVNGNHVSFSVTRDDGNGGELSAASLSLGYPFFENKLTPTLMLSYAHYKLSEYSNNLSDALSISIGAVYRPVRVLSIDAQAQWIQNKIYNNDTRLFIRVSYLLSQQLGIF
jgi:hypothetical protein